jgi:hypothetical protein
VGCRKSASLVRGEPAALRRAPRLSEAGNFLALWAALRKTPGGRTAGQSQLSDARDAGDRTRQGGRPIHSCDIKTGASQKRLEGASNAGGLLQLGGASGVFCQSVIAATRYPILDKIVTCCPIDDVAPFTNRCSAAPVSHARIVLPRSPAAFSCFRSSGLLAPKSFCEPIAPRARRMAGPRWREPRPGPLTPPLDRCRRCCRFLDPASCWRSRS